MAFSPHYASNHLFYVSYTDVNGNSRVVRYRSANGVGVRSSGQDPARRQPAVREPQRRPAPVRQAWLPLLRARRRRLRRRSRTARPEHAARGSASCCARSRSHPGTPLEDRRPRSAQPVALLLRLGERQPLDRRRRPGHVGGGRLPARRRSSTSSRTTAGAGTRATSVYDSSHRYAKAGAKVRPVHRVLARPRLLDHRRLRLSRHGGAGRRAGATSTATTAPARSGASASASTAAPRPPWSSGHVPYLSSFGVDGNGELYATSLDGTLYKLR